MDDIALRFRSLEYAAVFTQAGRLKVLLEGLVSRVWVWPQLAWFGFGFAGVPGKYIAEAQMPGALPLIASAFVIVAAAVIASALPAARAARVDAVQALRSE